MDSWESWYIFIIYDHFIPQNYVLCLKKIIGGSTVNYSPYQSLASSSHWCLQCFSIKTANIAILYIYTYVYIIYIYIYYIYVSYNVINSHIIFLQNTLVVTCCRILWIHCTSCPPRGLGVLHRVFPEEKDAATRARPGWADDDNMNQFGFNCHRDVDSSSWSSNFDR